MRFDGMTFKSQQTLARTLGLCLLRLFLLFVRTLAFHDQRIPLNLHCEMYSPKTLTHALRRFHCHLRGRSLCSYDSFFWFAFTYPRSRDLYRTPLRPTTPHTVTVFRSPKYRISTRALSRSATSLPAPLILIKNRELGTPSHDHLRLRSLQLIEWPD
jgi:hypothetical protein